MTSPLLGPAGSATLITRDLDNSIAAYTQHLDQQVYSDSRLATATAQSLGWPELENSRSVWLANKLNEPWLHLLEVPQARVRAPFTQYGWLALEISVQGVDALAERLADSPFEIIGPPADLEMSDAIRAMQVVGPSGEVLYLTEVKRAVPPFELPFPRCRVDRLFIPVTISPDRNKSLAHFKKLSGNDGLLFDTKITVINRAGGFPVEQQHPVATLQLAGKNLIEFDQLEGLDWPDTESSVPDTGIGLIHFNHPHGPKLNEQGPGGERYTLSTQTEGHPL